MLAPISGGNWDNGSNAGVFALNLNNDSGNSNDNVGFRDCAHGDASHGDMPTVDTGRLLSGLRTDQPQAKSEWLRLFGTAREDQS
jgi:hypothetical protein